MACLTLDESNVRLTAHRYAAPFESGFPCCERLDTPPDSGRKTALVRGIVRAVVPANGSDLQIVPDTGIWPSSECPRILELVRAGLGETRTNLHDYPGDERTFEPREDLECLLNVCMQNIWDTWLFRRHPPRGGWCYWDSGRRQLEGLWRVGSR